MAEGVGGSAEKVVKDIRRKTRLWGRVRSEPAAGVGRRGGGAPPLGVVGPLSPFIPA
jgi:hypothetical protein